MAIRNKDARPLFYGVPNVRIQWRGEWADPEVHYNKKAVNYYQLEGCLWEDFQSEELSSDEEEFAIWVKKNPRLVKEYIQLIA